MCDDGEKNVKIPIEKVFFPSYLFAFLLPPLIPLMSVSRGKFISNVIKKRIRQRTLATLSEWKILNSFHLREEALSVAFYSRQSVKIRCLHSKPLSPR